MAAHSTKEVHCEQEPIAAVPQPLLARILIPGTSLQDKKTLRQVCKLFRQVLDDSLACISLVFGPVAFGSDPKENQRCLEKFKQRIQYAHGLRTVELSTWYKMDNLTQSLPVNVTTLKLHGGGNNIDAKELARLPCLTSLALGAITITGMEHISGLTHLHCDRPVGCLAHLAPTLKHLSIQDYSHVQNMNQLTSVEVLEVRRNMPTDFFHTHDQMPLRCMCIYPAAYKDFYENTEAWQLAPTTLTCLNMGSTYEYGLPRVLPKSVTHLQLMILKQGVIEQAAVALPGLIHLDVCVITQSWQEDWDAFKHLSRLSNLESLGMWYYRDRSTLSRENVLSQLPGLSDAVERGVKVTVVKGPEELLGVFKDPWAEYANVETTWTVI